MVNIVMKIEQQVCSLELSKKLKELGVKQESLFHWYFHQNKNKKFELGILYGKKELMESQWSAFTVAELGEMLPGGICQTDKINKERDPDLKSYCIYLAGDSFHAKDDNEANARAKMLIHLIENKLITL